MTKETGTGTVTLLHNAPTGGGRLQEAKPRSRMTLASATGYVNCAEVMRHKNDAFNNLQVTVRCSGQPP